MGTITNMISEVQAAFATRSVGSYILLGLYGVILLFAFLCALKGYLRGVLRMTIRILTVGASAVGAFLIASKIYPFLAKQLEGKTFGDLLSWFGGSLSTFLGENAINTVNSADPTTAKYLIALPLVLIVVPLLFVSIFLVLLLLTKIIYALLSNLLGFSKKPNVVLRLFGMIAGVAEGAIIAVAVLIPAVGLLNFMATTAPDLPEESPVNAVYENYAKPAAESTLVSTVNRFGGEYLFKTFSTIDMDGETCDLREPAAAIVGIIADSSDLTGANWQELTPENEGTLRRMVARIGDDTYLSTLFSGLAQSFGAYVDENPAVIPFEEPFRSVVMDAVGVLKETTKETIKPDFNTILDVYFILSDSGALPYFSTDSDTATEKLVAKNADGKTAIQCAIDALNANPRTAKLVTSVTRLALTYISEEAGSEVVTIFEDTKEKIIDEVLTIDREGKTDEEYVEAVSDALKDVLNEQGIELNEETLDGMASFIADGDFDPANVTDEDICNIILNYFDSYVASAE